jgi:SAM-dependent methyltransferase
MSCSAPVGRSRERIISRETAHIADLEPCVRQGHRLRFRARSLEPTFDLITSFDAIHDQRDPAAVLRSAATALAPDGSYLVVEPRASSNLEENVGNPFGPWMYGVSVLHCMTVSLAEGGVGLGTAWGEQMARRFLAEAGFTSVDAVDAPGPQNTIYICRR